MQFPDTQSGRFPLLAALSLVLLAPPVLAEDPLPSVDRLQSSPVLRQLKPNPMPAPPRTPAEQTVSQMYLPSGFRAELVASEPDVLQPVAFIFDERGRIWVAEALSYPARRPIGQGLDRLLILEDRDGDGRFETRKVFAGGLNLVSGFEVGHGGVWVGAAPELLFIPDRNRDDVPDGPPEVLLDGFGFQDTHECLNSFLWGPDGWLYGNQGVFNFARIGKPGAPEADRTELRAGVWRYHPVRRQFEVFAHGGSNPWGLDYDERGQIFMTHCRSYFGRGCTTHVIQGGHFWNQANANYAPFIVANPPAEFPGFRNFLLASARYDHGAGGAGKPGSDAIYGGHSHVGTMIYLGDNWPEEFRGHLFTHNLGGHQINHQINRRLGSGFDTVHAGFDQFFCSDPKYVAVDLQYGPDGAVYVIDWYDQQHCHNPNTERWDRSNGRIYRLQYEATYRSARVDLGSKTGLELVALLTNRNEWYARTALRLLNERHDELNRTGARTSVDPRVSGDVVKLATEGSTPANRLKGLWAAQAMGLFNSDLARATLKDPDEYVRAWAIQLATEASTGVEDELIRLAKDDPSPVVRLYLASAVQRVSDETAWKLIEALAQHGEDRDDRNLPWLLWQGLAQRMPNQLDRAFAIARTTPIPQLADYIHWYAATLDNAGLDRVVAVLTEARGDDLRRRLAGLWLAMEPRANVPMPAAWKSIAPSLYQNEDARVRRQAEQLAAAFGDDSMFPGLRETLAKADADPAARKHAFAVLGRAQDRASLPVFLALLDDAQFRSPALGLVSRFDDPAVADALIRRFDQMSPADRAAALNALTSRPGFALALLEAVSAGRIKRDQLTALHIRQLTALRNAEIDRRVATTWGRVVASPAEKQALMTKLEKTFDEAPLWAYESRAGRQHYQKLCASCHRLGEDGVRLGPELTGAGKNGIRYFLENIIDPDAVVGTDFEATTVVTRDGEVISGLVINESSSALTLRTTTAETQIAKADISKREASAKSLMPEGLLEAMSEREQLELLKYLTSH